MCCLILAVSSCKENRKADIVDRMKEIDSKLPDMKARWERAFDNKYFELKMYNGRNHTDENQKFMKEWASKNFGNLIDSIGRMEKEYDSLEWELKKY